MTLIGKIKLTGHPYESYTWKNVCNMSVKALRYEPFHTRLLLYPAKGSPFWSPPCEVELASRLSDRRLIGVVRAMEFVCSTYISVVNIVAVDYERAQITRVEGFLPFELARDKAYRFEYQILLRGKHDAVS